MNATTILNYVAWHLGIRVEHAAGSPPRITARITYMGSEREKAPTTVSSDTSAATGATDEGQSQP
jgi:hypothetical protein